MTFRQRNKKKKLNKKQLVCKNICISQRERERERECVCMCVCVCEREREREREEERERERVFESLQLYIE